MAPWAPYANLSSLGERLLFGNPAVPVEVSSGHPAGFSSDRVVYQYVDRPRLHAVRPAIVAPDDAAPLLLLGRGFLPTPAVACKFGSRWGPSARVLNETAIECLPPPLADVARGQSLPLVVSLNGYDIELTYA